MLVLTKEKLKSYQGAKVCYIWGEKSKKGLAKEKNDQKIGNPCHYTGKYRGTSHSIYNFKFNVSYEIDVVFHNGYKL